LECTSDRNEEFNPELNTNERPLKKDAKKMGNKSFGDAINFQSKSHNLLLFVVLLLVCNLASAQLQRYPIKRSSAPVSSIKANSAGRTKQAAPLSLPFWDDFSTPYKTFYPDTSRWQYGFSIWVNDGMAINPPTLNVATFDGLDSAGVAYNPNDILANGFRDSLVSKTINLSETGSKPVAVSERASVYFSFMYEWGGNGEPPDPNDYLQLEFMNKQSQWEIVMKIKPKDSFKKDVFYDTIVQVNGGQFFHNAFQFRFRSYGRQSGPYDAWHVDYVYLNKGRNINDLSFPDRALSTEPGPLFGRFYAMPKRHFLSNNQFTQPKFEIENLKNVAASVNFRTEGFFSSTNLKTHTTVVHQTTVSKATPINITDNVIQANEHKTIRLDTLPNLNDPLQFPANMDSTLIRLTVALQTKDDIPQNNKPPIEPDSTGDYTPNYKPIKFANNDTITTDYVLSSYYAYDDGKAEFAAGLIQAGNLIAYEFDLAEGIKQDTLLGFDIYFPPFGMTSNQTVDFFIYHQKDSTGLPKDEPWLRIPARVISRKGINEFQRIKFIPALLIDEKKFYIGWKQPVSGKLVVGLDISNDTGDKMFVNTNNYWYLNNTVTGSLMIRPIFGSGFVDAQVGVEEEKLEFAIYPNPSQGSFYIQGKVDQLQILSSTGQPVPFDKEESDERIFVQLHQPAGLYVVRCTSNKTTKSYKIIVAK
jgi:hypothetical protein